MRLTSDVLLEARQGLNCVGDRELVLRNLAIPAIENLDCAKDSFDTIDLSFNMISVLGPGFAVFPRVKTLFLSSNRIDSIRTGLSSSLPNLQTLILTSNRIATVDALNLPQLAKLEHLQVLSILHNPVLSTKTAQLRNSIVRALPALKVYNFSKVSVEERAAAGTTAISKKKARKRKHTNDNDNDNDNDNGSENENDNNNTPRKKAKPPPLTAEQSQAVRAYIANAQSIDQVNQIQQAIRDGTVLKFLASRQTAPPLQQGVGGIETS